MADNYSNAAGGLGQIMTYNLDVDGRKLAMK